MAMASAEREKLTEEFKEDFLNVTTNRYVRCRNDSKTNKCKLQ